MLRLGHFIHTHLFLALFSSLIKHHSGRATSVPRFFSVRAVASRLFDKIQHPMNDANAARDELKGAVAYGVEKLLYTRLVFFYFLKVIVYI